MPCGNWAGWAKFRPTRMNRLILPSAQVCQRASVKASAASRAISAAAAGRSVLAAGGRDGRAPTASLLVAAGAPAGRTDSPPSGVTGSAARSRAGRWS